MSALETNQFVPVVEFYVTIWTVVTSQHLYTSFECFYFVFSIFKFLETGPNTLVYFMNKWLKRGNSFISSSNSVCPLFFSHL
jgi:hypothetical protein